MKDLFDAYFIDTTRMGEGWRELPEGVSEESKARHIADYLAGMTDTYALMAHRRMFDRTPDLG